jgi:hypothetical protein
MKQYSFSITLLTTLKIEAASRDEAIRIIRGICHGGKIVVTEDADNMDCLEGVCDIEGGLDFIGED